MEPWGYTVSGGQNVGKVSSETQVKEYLTMPTMSSTSCWGMKMMLLYVTDLNESIHGLIFDHMASLLCMTSIL